MSSHRGYYDKGDKRTQRDIDEDEMAESIHSNLVENLFDEEEALLNLHMNVIQGRLISHIRMQCSSHENINLRSYFKSLFHSNNIFKYFAFSCLRYK